MLTRNQLANIARRNHVGLGVQERDYIENLFLFLLSGKTQDLIFKGGTALRIAYNFARYSEDLDFNSDLQSGEVVRLLKITTKELSSFGVRAEFKRIKIFKENGVRGVTGDISYAGPLFTGKPTSKGKVRIDVSLRGEEAETQRIVVGAKYDDVAQYVLTVFTLEEILAEKVRALIIRSKPRDLYDLWVLLESGAQVDFNLINRKLQLYERTLVLQEFISRLQAAEEGWERDLQELLPQTALFDEVKEAVVQTMFPVYLYMHHALEGIAYLKKSRNLTKLRYNDRLERIEGFVDKFIQNNNLNSVNKVLELYRFDNVFVPNGKNAYEITIWNAEVRVRGKATTLEYIFNNIEDEWQKLRKFLG